jgi:hypothetical protein
MRSGTNVALLASALPADAAMGISTEISYEESIVDAESEQATQTLRPLAKATAAGTMPDAIVAELTKAGPVAHAQTGTTGADAFAASSRAIRVRGERYVPAVADTLTPTPGSPATGTSCSEAHDRLKATASGELSEVALLHEAA